MRAGAALRSAMGSDIEARVGALDWSRIVAGLDAQGWAFIRQLLTARESKALADLYESGARFRSQVVMARHDLQCAGKFNGIEGDRPRNDDHHQQDEHHP
jgi:hypothetical protein